MEKMKDIKSINGVVEPDFLQYIKETFKKWNTLYENGVIVGSREMMKFQDICKGARMNARYGFEYSCKIELDEAEEEEKQFIMMIFRNKDTEKMQEPLYIFSAPMHQ